MAPQIPITPLAPSQRLHNLTHKPINPTFLYREAETAKE